MHRFADRMPYGEPHVPLPRDWMERPDPLGTPSYADSSEERQATETRYVLYALIGTYLVFGYVAAFGLGLLMGSG